MNIDREALENAARTGLGTAELGAGAIKVLKGMGEVAVGMPISGTTDLIQGGILGIRGIQAIRDARDRVSQSAPLSLSDYPDLMVAA